MKLTTKINLSKPEVTRVTVQSIPSSELWLRKTNINLTKKGA
jgi:hypothetical protein